MHLMLRTDVERLRVNIPTLLYKPVPCFRMYLFSESKSPQAKQFPSDLLYGGQIILKPEYSSGWMSAWALAVHKSVENWPLSFQEAGIRSFWIGCLFSLSSHSQSSIQAGSKQLLIWRCLISRWGESLTFWNKFSVPGICQMFGASSVCRDREPGEWRQIAPDIICMVAYCWVKWPGPDWGTVVC